VQLLVHQLVLGQLILQNPHFASLLSLRVLALQLGELRLDPSEFLLEHLLALLRHFEEAGVGELQCLGLDLELSLPLFRKFYSFFEFLSL